MGKIKVKRFLPYLLIFAISLGILLLSVLLRYYRVNIFGLGGLVLTTVVLSIAYFVLTVVVLKRYGRRLSKIGIILAIIIGFMDIPSQIIHFQSSLITFPELIARFLAVGAGYIFTIYKNNIVKIIVPLLAFSIIFTFALFGYKYYGNYLTHGNLTGKLPEKEIKTTPVVLQDKDGVTFALTDLPEEFLIFDMWYSGCGVCYTMFPKVQEVYDVYKDNDRVGLYSIHCRMAKRGEGAAAGSGILAEIGYSFPNLSMDIDNPVLKEFGVYEYPTVLVFDGDRRLIFRGGITLVEDFISKKLAGE